MDKQSIINLDDVSQSSLTEEMWQGLDAMRLIDGYKLLNIYGDDTPLEKQPTFGQDAFYELFYLDGTTIPEDKIKRDIMQIRSL